MPPRSAFAGGYSEGIRRQLDGIVISDRIKCSICKKIRMQSAFSKRQMEILRNAMLTEGAKALSGRAPIRCRNCCGNQNVELRCTVCDKVKSLEGFAKNQRGERDSARCLTCVQHHADTDPVIEDQKLLIENIRNTGETLKLTGQADQKTGEVQKLKGPSTDDEDLSCGGGVWVEPERQNREDGIISAKARDGHAAKPDPVKAVARTSFAQSGSAGGRPVMAPSSKRPPPPKKESKFARVPAQYIDDDSERPKFTLPQGEEDGILAPSDDDEEDEDDIETFI